MQIRYDTETACLVVRLDYEIDHHSATLLRADIDAAIYAHLPRTLVLDLADVAFMDSSGIGLIMGRYKILSPLGSEIVLRDPAPHIAQILRFAGMERLARITRSAPKEVV
ncbi:MAG: anti-sigma factor antagonist [Oscillospiraceae bacterium]|nr:anti-sigma factor antagonist [Oscillospiraceae bacterium]